MENRTGKFGQIDWENGVRDGRKDEGPAEGKVLHSAVMEMETGGRSGRW